MGWGGRFGATWRGKVSGADLSAMFVATSRLSDLQQSLADRRLDARIALADQPDHAGQDWRIVLSVGPLAAPLWLAETVVGLAQAFYDAVTTGQPEQRDPDHPPLVSPYAHDLIAALLAPVEDIIADVTTALADPNHHIGLTAPIHIGPGHDLAGDEPPRPPDLAYARGLAKATRRIHTSAAALLLDTQTTLTKSSEKSSAPPDWLTTGLQRLNGELQGAGVRLDMLETRMEPLLQVGRESAARNADPSALSAMCADLWTITDTAFVAGQQISDPHLLPEAPPVVAPRAATPPQPATRQPSQQSTRPAPIRTSGPQAPARPSPTYRSIAPGVPPDPLPPARAPQPPQSPQPLPPPDRALPQIAEGAPSTPSQAHPASAAPTPLSLPMAGGAHAPTPPRPDVAAPSVGGAPGVVATSAPHPVGAPPTTPMLHATASAQASLPTIGAPAGAPASALPAVGDASRQAPVEPPTPQALQGPPAPAPSEVGKPQAETNAKVNGEAPTLFPEIG